LRFGREQEGSSNRVLPKQRYPRDSGNTEEELSLKTLKLLFLAVFKHIVTIISRNHVQRFSETLELRVSERLAYGGFLPNLFPDVLSDFHYRRSFVLQRSHENCEGTFFLALGRFLREFRHLGSHRSSETRPVSSRSRYIILVQRSAVFVDRVFEIEVLFAGLYAPPSYRATEATAVDLREHFSSPSVPRGRSTKPSSKKTTLCSAGCVPVVNLAAPVRCYWDTAIELRLLTPMPSRRRLPSPTMNCSMPSLYEQLLFKIVERARRPGSVRIGRRLFEIASSVEQVLRCLSSLIEVGLGRDEEPRCRRTLVRSQSNDRKVDAERQS